MSLNPVMAWLVAALVAATGCATSSSSASRPARDAVLVACRQAAGAIRAGQFEKAKPLLDDVLITLGGISAGDKSARQARSLFRGEDSKTFRGEPYERVMAYYYRGILYWMDGEPDNARACFRSAQLQDSDAAEGYRSDFVLLDYLEGLATAKLAGDGSDAYRRSKSAARLGSLPPGYNPAANVLIFTEIGQGPTKTAGGQYGEILQIQPGGQRARSARIVAGNQTATAPLYDDLTFQATTRGGRVMDRVLANKAAFKQGTDAFGDVGLLSGALLATQQGRKSNADEIGAGLLAAAVVSKLFSAATTPRADTRSWDNLPNQLGFAAFQLPPGTYDATVDFLDGTGQKTAGRTIHFTVVPNRDTVLFASDRN